MQNLNVSKEGDGGVAARAGRFESVRVVEDKAAVLLPGWTLEDIDTIGEYDESRSPIGRLKHDLSMVGD